MKRLKCTAAMSPDVLYLALAQIIITVCMVIEAVHLRPISTLLFALAVLAIAKAR